MDVEKRREEGAAVGVNCLGALRTAVKRFIVGEVGSAISLWISSKSSSSKSESSGVAAEYKDASESAEFVSDTASSKWHSTGKSSGQDMLAPNAPISSLYVGRSSSIERSKTGNTLSPLFEPFVGDVGSTSEKSSTSRHFLEALPVDLMPEEGL